MKIQLTTPIEAHGEKIEAIELQTPKGVHIRACGIPFALEDDGAGGTRTIYNAAAVAKYISMLGGVPPSAVDALSAMDFNKLMNGIVSFFSMPTTPTTSSGDTGNSANSMET